MLANDGFATNVLRQSNDASYTIIDDLKLMWDDELASDKKLVTYSLSHPNPTRWYAKPKVNFVWSAANDARFTYALTNIDTKEVVFSGTTTVNNLTETVTESGVYDFVVKAYKGNTFLGAGSTTVRIDLTPPDDIDVVISHYSIKVGEIVRMIIRGEDHESGLSGNYYVSIDGSTLLPVGGVVFIPFTTRGTQEVVVRVFDKAGNYVDRTKVIKVGQ